MKRDFIKNLIPDIEKEVLDQIMDEHGKDVEAQNAAITALTTERDGLKEQLTAANGEIQSYKDMDIDGIKSKAAEWESKYNADTEALRNQLEEAEYAHTVQTAVSSYKFTSESAKKAFIADLTAKKLQVQDGKLLGLEDYTKSYKENDPGAFASDKPAARVIVGGSGTNLVDVTPESYAKMGFAERLKLKNEQPELYKELTAK